MGSVFIMILLPFFLSTHLVFIRLQSSLIMFKPPSSLTFAVQPPYGCYVDDHLDCETFGYDPEPGDIVEQDIHLSDSGFLVGMPERKIPDHSSVTVLCVPNPVQTTMKVMISSDFDLYGSLFRITDIHGRTVFESSIRSSDSAPFNIDRSELGPAGAYVYSLLRGGSILRSGLIICQ